MFLFVIWVLFVLVSASLGVLWADAISAVAKGGEVSSWVPMVAFFTTVVVAVLVVVLDVLIRRKDISRISSVYLGLLVGVILVVGLALDRLV